MIKGKWIAVLCLILIQALVLNHIHLFQCMTPLLYVVVVMRMPLGQERWQTLLWAFATGILIDILSNTPGQATAALTLLAFIQPMLLNAFFSDENDMGVVPSLHVMGFMRFFVYASIMVLIYCLVFFTLEIFSFVDPLLWLETTFGSALLTLIIIFFVEKIIG